MQNSLLPSAPQLLIKPDALLHTLPIDQEIAVRVAETRAAIARIMQGTDKRLLVVVGPCSIHDPVAAIEYAALLKKAADTYADELCIVMRTYFEKPRTLLGWKGLLRDPFLNGCFDINAGLQKARHLLITLNKMGIPAGTEFLDPLLTPFFSDLISWSAIGARTSSSQIHRELASDLPMPVGFKNTIDGNIKIAVDAVKTAAEPHSILRINGQGETVIVETTGNAFCHVVLRGSDKFVNYESSYVEKTVMLLQEAGLNTGLMIDCSHGNSGKNYLQQVKAVECVAEQIRGGVREIRGVMLESYLVSGRQALQSSGVLVYGQSVTDECLSWGETLPLLELLASVGR